MMLAFELLCLMNPWMVPGLEAEMTSLAEMHRLHLPRARTQCTLWDPWLPHATLWTGPEPRQYYRRVFLQRKLDEQGYVSMQQHRGMAHSEGWPFPAWQQSTGRGWHFSVAGDVWAVQSFGTQPQRHFRGWQLKGVEVVGFDDARGAKLRVTDSPAVITVPAFRCGTIVAPFVRFEWAARQLPEDAEARLRWRLESPDSANPPRAAEHRGEVMIEPPAAEMRYQNVPLYRQPGYAGVLSGLQVVLTGASGAEIDLKSIITAVDTRHPITGALFIQGATEYFNWTKEIDFLRQCLPKLRRALAFSLDEFSVRTEHHVRVPWVGHDGRSGLVPREHGKPEMRPGLGVGNNYWDLLPFGGHDGLATIYLYDALRRMAALESAIESHPEWELPEAEPDADAAALDQLAARVREEFQSRFWNPQTGRFLGWQDLRGRGYDYGFTFVNLEAIHYGLASDDQARAIFAWLDGERTVAGDTSTGGDIYHWRFAPRATTRRNVETYVWAWSDPAAIPWGGQIQDGGAVLGFSYFDVMARLDTLGPDAAWQRLSEIIDWFDAVQTAGGYRAYYAEPGRGTLQGGGTAGGLGLDEEFRESVMLPQVMLYGFLGFRPTPTGYEINPRLPSGWPSLTLYGVHLGDRVVDITATADGEVELVDSNP